MNKICNTCKHQNAQSSIGLVCDFEFSECTSYGTFKRGCNCIYDADLKDLYEQAEGASSNMESLSKVLKKLGDMVVGLREENEELKRRLTRIEE